MKRTAYLVSASVPGLDPRLLLGITDDEGTLETKIRLAGGAQPVHVLKRSMEDLLRSCDMELPGIQIVCHETAMPSDIAADRPSADAARARLLSIEQAVQSSPRLLLGPPGAALGYSMSVEDLRKQNGSVQTLVVNKTCLSARKFTASAGECPFDSTSVGLLQADDMGLVGLLEKLARKVELNAAVQNDIAPTLGDRALRRLLAGVEISREFPLVGREAAAGYNACAEAVFSDALAPLKEVLDSQTLLLVDDTVGAMASHLAAAGFRAQAADGPDATLYGALNWAWKDPSRTIPPRSEGQQDTEDTGK